MLKRKNWGMPLFFTLSFVFMFAGMFSCNHNKPNTDEVKKVKVFFSSNQIGKAEITATVEGGESTSTRGEDSLEVEVDKVITFTAQVLDDEWEISHWLGVDSQTDDKKSATLKVKKLTNVDLVLSKKPDPTVRVTYHIENEFDDAGMHRGIFRIIDKSNTKDGPDGTTVNSGDEVPINHVLWINANPNKAKAGDENGRVERRIKAWLKVPGGLNIPPTTEDFVYTIQKSDVEKGIDVVVEFEEGKVVRPPLPDNKVYVDVAVFMWDDLDYPNYLEGGTLNGSINGGPTDQVGGEFKFKIGDVLEMIADLKPGKEIYKWTGEGIEVDPTDNKKAKLTVTGEADIKCIVKDVGTSLFTVQLIGEDGEPVNGKEAKIVARDNGVVCKSAAPRYEALANNDILLEMISANPAYQVESWEITPNTVTLEKDSDNPNKATIKTLPSNNDVVVKVKLKKVDTIDITIKGDENVENDSKVKFKVAKDIVWKLLKEKVEIAGIKIKEGFKLDKWVKGDDSTGADLEDTYKFESSQTIFAKTTIQMRKVTLKVQTNDWENPQEIGSDKVELKATIEGTGEVVVSGQEYPQKTKINIVATIKDPSFSIERWEPWYCKADKATAQTSTPKASLEIGNEDVNIIAKVKEVVEVTIDGDANVKAESKKKIKVNKGIKWQSLKWNQAFNTNKDNGELKFNDGFKFAKLLKGNASGEEIADDYAFDTSQTVYVVSRDANISKVKFFIKRIIREKNEEGKWVEKETKLYTGDDIKLTATKVLDGTEVLSGSDVTVGTKINLVVSRAATPAIKLGVAWWNHNYKCDFTEDSNAPNHTKASITIKEEDAEVYVTVHDVIDLKVDGDEHVSAETKAYTAEVQKGYQWGYMSWTFEEKLKFEEGYVLDKLHKATATGDELTYDYLLEEDIVIYVTSKQL